MLTDGQHTSWVGKELLVSMGYASELAHYHNLEEQDINEEIYEAKDEDNLFWLDNDNETT